MKIFFDSNVLIAAYITHGSCYELYRHCLDDVVFSSEFVRREVLGKLTKKIKLADEKARWAYTHLCMHTTLVAEGQLEVAICRDSDDDHIIAAAIRAKADCIITGDDDLLVLKKVSGIPIFAPGDFWKFESTSIL